MNLADPIIQSYIYTDVYNSLGGANSAQSTTAGLPISKLVVSESTQNGGTNPRMGRHSIEHLSVPAGLVLIKEPERHKIVYKHKSEKSISNCEVVPDDLFDKMVELASDPSSKRRKTESARRKKGARETRRR